jgi:Acetyltransferase (GNAT) domain
MKNTFYTYREAQNITELEALLKLRYKVYRKSKYINFCPKNKHQINLDQYDLYSRHFGLFENKSGIEKPVGYMRVVQEERSPTANQVLEIAKKASPKLADSLQIPVTKPFPLMTYFRGSEKVNSVLARLASNGLKMCEASRFVFAKEIRSLQLAKFVTESSVAIYRALGFYCSIITCSIPHSRFYNQYGFSQLKGTGLHIGHSQPPLLLLLLLSQDVPSSKENKIDQMSKTFNDHNAICFHPNKPKHFCPPQTIKIKVSTGKVIVAA